MMETDRNSLPVCEIPANNACCRWSYAWVGGCVGIALSILVGVAFFLGRMSGPASSNTTWNGIPTSRVPPELLAASSSIGGSNMAVCTAPVGEDSEGFFALDFITGELKAWVYYPRMGGFGGLFMTNVQPMLGASKNPEYLLVSGLASTPPSGGNIRLAPSLVYVVDMKTGFFAAYTVPWDKSRESTGMSQMSPMVFVGGGQIREPMGTGIKKPTTPPAAVGGTAAPQGAVAPNAKKPDANNADPNAAANPANNQPPNTKGKK